MPLPAPLLSRFLRFVFDAAILIAAVVMLLAAALKLTDLDSFAQALTLHHRLDAPAPPSLPLALGALQLLLGSLVLWLFVTRRPAGAGMLLSLSFCLLAAYSAYLCINPPSEPASCGCGFSKRVYSAADWRNSAVANACISIGFALVASMVLRLPVNPPPAAPAAACRS